MALAHQGAPHRAPQWWLTLVPCVWGNLPFPILWGAPEFCIWVVLQVTTLVTTTAYAADHLLRAAESSSFALGLP